MAKTNASKTPKLKSDGSLQQLGLEHLHLDDGNPRFGGREKRKASEIAILDEIVAQHGITDVLCSISANGFFSSEPIVGAINKSHAGAVTIVEGNRRLTACLIIAGDERAKNHKTLASKYQSELFTAEMKLPVQVYDWENKEHRNKLLPYLGIRHIVGGAQWDSYAKAAWVATTLKESDLSIADIRAMIGDEQKFIDRIVEGYYFVEQALKSNAYDPAESLRAGRGSFHEFPFSWVYTALGYRSVREFLRLPKENLIEPEPVSEDSTEAVGQLLGYMFGASGRNAAIDDSRHIGKLAKALTSEVSVAALEKGESAEEAIELLRPLDTRCAELIKKADKALADAITISSGFRRVGKSIIRELQDGAEDVAHKADTLYEVLGSAGEKSRAKKKKRGGSR